MKEIIDYTIFKYSNLNITVFSILKLIVFIIAILLLLKIIRKAIYKVEKIDVAKKYSIYNLARYVIILVAIIAGLQLFGFDLTVLVAGSAALLVGVGLGLQNLFSDFISGILLLLDSSVKVNDVIELNGMVCTVQEINLRTTTVLTRDDKYIILPNSDLTKNQLINWSHSNLASRFEVTVGVDYSSDIKQVMSLLKETVNNQNGILEVPAPFIRFTDFGDSSLNFSIFFWSEELFRVENIKSEMRIKIFESFNANNITIPFPQRVVHINK
jgi:small-conductance mechanosensitive channel